MRLLHITALQLVMGNGAHMQTQPRPISEKRTAYSGRMDKRKRHTTRVQSGSTLDLKKVSMRCKAKSSNAVSVDHASHFS